MPNMRIPSATATNEVRSDLMQGKDAELIDHASTTCVQTAAVTMERDGALSGLPDEKSLSLVVAIAMNGMQSSRKLNSTTTVTLSSTFIFVFETRTAGRTTRNNSVMISRTRMVMLRACYAMVSSSSLNDAWEL